MTETERLKLRKPEGNDYYSVDDFNHNMDILEETAGVASFNGRSGTVVPQAGDYTADMVDAAPAFANFFASGGIEHSANISGAGWYRICAANQYTSLFLHISQNYNSITPADIYAIVTCQYYAPKIVIINAAGWNGGAHSIDDLRLTHDAETGNFYVDLHYALSGENAVNANIIVSFPRNPTPIFERMSFTPVADAPDGETVMCNADWQNPPMYLGVEYRTTERYNGAPVYYKLWRYGNLPNASSLDVEHNLPPLASIWIDFSKSVISHQTSYHPQSGGTNLASLHPNITKVIPRINEYSKAVINIETVADMSAYVAFLCLKYTKYNE